MTLQRSTDGGYLHCLAQLVLGACCLAGISEALGKSSYHST